MPEDEDPYISKLTTPEECDQFEENVRDTDPVLALKAKKKGVRLRAKQAGAKTQVEEEAWAAVIAYEAVRTKPGGRRFRASRTRQMIERHGILGAVERAVDRDDDPTGYTSLAAMNMTDLSFEAVVLRHPDAFSAKIVERCHARLAKYGQQA